MSEDLPSHLDDLPPPKRLEGDPNTVRLLERANRLAIQLAIAEEAIRLAAIFVEVRDADPAYRASKSAYIYHGPG
jgi:hypothetical protein